MRTINANRGFVILVDDEDYATLSQHNWTVAKYKHTFYAYRNLFDGHKVLGHVFMHREILGLKKGDGIKVDHWDRNGLNNQRYNLRPSDTSSNNANRIKTSGRSSRFKGVWLDKRRGTWEASIKVNRKKHYLGAFLDEMEAARAYNAAAKLHFGAFALLNEITPQHSE